MPAGTIEKYKESNRGFEELVKGEYQAINDNYWKNRIEYHQGDIGHTSSCQTHAPLTVISNLFGYEFSLEEQILYWEYNVKTYGMAVGVGGNFVDGVEGVCNVWNKYNPDKKVNYYIIKNNSKEYRELMDLGYMCVSGGKFNKLYKNDYQEDGILDETTELSYTTYGHALTFIKPNYEFPDSDVCIIDTFKKTQDHNVYGVRNFDKLLDNGVFFWGSYFIIPQSHILDDKKKDLMNTPIHKYPTNPDDIEIAEARAKVIEAGHDPLYRNYEDNQYLTKMLIDIAFFRAENPIE